MIFFSSSSSYFARLERHKKIQWRIPSPRSPASFSWACSQAVVCAINGILASGIVSCHRDSRCFFSRGGGYFGTMTCNLIYSSSLRNWNWICFSCNVYSYFVRSSWHVLRSSGRWDPIRARAWGGKRGKSSPKKVGSCSKSGRKLWWKVFSSASKSHYRESPSDCFWRQGKRKFGGWKLPLETNRLSTRKDYGTLGRFKFSLVGRVECGIGAMIVLCFNCPSIQSKWFSLA